MDLSNYAAKADLKNAAGVYTSSFATKTELAFLKFNLDKLDIDKLAAFPADLSKLSNVVENDVVQKDVYNAKIKNIDNKIPDISNTATKTTLNAKINEVKGEISSITNLVTTTALTAVEIEIHNVSYLVTKTDYNTKVNKTEKKNY